MMMKAADGPSTVVGSVGECVAPHPAPWPLTLERGHLLKKVSSSIHIHIRCSVVSAYHLHTDSTINKWYIRNVSVRCLPLASSVVVEAAENFLLFMRPLRVFFEASFCISKRARRISSWSISNATSLHAVS